MRIFEKSNLQNEIAVARDGSEALAYLLGKNQASELNGYALGANAYVRKPVEFAAFTDAARTLGLFGLLSSEPVLAD